jgi:hypothetical protein
MHHPYAPARADRPRAHDAVDPGPAPGAESRHTAERERLLRGSGRPSPDVDDPGGWYGPIPTEPIPGSSPDPDGRRAGMPPGPFSPETSDLLAWGRAVLAEAAAIRQSTRDVIESAKRTRKAIHRHRRGVGPGPGSTGP